MLKRICGCICSNVYVICIKIGIICIGLLGGMVDTTDLKSVDLTVVPVRVRQQVSVTHSITINDELGNDEPCPNLLMISAGFVLQSCANMDTLYVSCTIYT